MNPLEHWHEIIFNYRQMIDKHGSTWHGQHAQWYDGWIRQNDYASIIYPLYQPYVKGRVLEIGAGTGLFTAYLVKDAEHVTALDPSADMLYYLLRNVPVLTRLETIQLKIEDFLLPSQGYDFILASHALFNVMEIDQVLCKLMGACPCMGLLIGSGEGLALYTAIKRKFNIKEKKGRPPCHKDLLPILDELKIHYTWQLIETKTEYLYGSKEELLDNLAKSCDLEEKHYAAFCEFVRPYIQEINGKWAYSGVRQHICFTLQGNSIQNQQFVRAPQETMKL